MKQTTKITPKNSVKSRFLVIGGIILVCVVIFSLGWNYLNRNTNNPEVHVITVKKVPTNPIKAGNQSSSGSTIGDKTSSSGGAAANTDVVILIPGGTFVSNHEPSLSGSTTPSSEESVCNGSPGANCYVQFTNTDTNVIYKLPSKTLDTSGTAYWSWDVSDNLTQGTWSILAVSTLGQQTKSASDSRNLVVGP